MRSSENKKGLLQMRRKSSGIYNEPLLGQRMLLGEKAEEEQG